MTDSEDLSSLKGKPLSIDVESGLVALKGWSHKRLSLKDVVLWCKMTTVMGTTRFCPLPSGFSVKELHHGDPTASPPVPCPGSELWPIWSALREEPSLPLSAPADLCKRPFRNKSLQGESWDGSAQPLFLNLSNSGWSMNNNDHIFISIHFSYSVTKLCLTLCDPMDCSTPGFPVPHYLLEFAETHVHWVGDAIQPSHPLLPPSVFLGFSNGRLPNSKEGKSIFHTAP